MMVLCRAGPPGVAALLKGLRLLLRPTTPTSCRWRSAGNQLRRHGVDKGRGRVSDQPSSTATNITTPSVRVHTGGLAGGGSFAWGDSAGDCCHVRPQGEARGPGPAESWAWAARIPRNARQIVLGRLRPARSRVAEVWTLDGAAGNAVKSRRLPSRSGPPPPPSGGDAAAGVIRLLERSSCTPSRGLRRVVGTSGEFHPLVAARAARDQCTAPPWRARWARKGVAATRRRRVSAPWKLQSSDVRQDYGRCSPADLDKVDSLH